MDQLYVGCMAVCMVGCMAVCMVGCMAVCMVGCTALPPYTVVTMHLAASVYIRYPRGHLHSGVGVMSGLPHANTTHLSMLSLHTAW